MFLFYTIFLLTKLSDFESLENCFSYKMENSGINISINDLSVIKRSIDDQSRDIFGMLEELRTEIKVKDMKQLYQHIEFKTQINNLELKVCLVK